MDSTTVNRNIQSSNVSSKPRFQEVFNVSQKLPTNIINILTDMQNRTQNIEKNIWAQYSTKSNFTNELSEYFIENLIEGNKTEILSNNTSVC